MTEETKMTDKHYEYCERTGKVCYSVKEASQVVTKVRKTNYSGRYKKHSTGKIPKRIYRCKFCGCFHTTSYKTKRVDRGLLRLKKSA